MTSANKVVPLHDPTPSPLQKIPNSRAAPTPEPKKEEDKPATPEGRIGRWKSKLLDLSKRNRLLNFKIGSSGIDILCPNIAGLEDSLAAGKAFRFVSLVDLLAELDPEELEKDPDALQRKALIEAYETGHVVSGLGPADLDRRLVKIYRQGKSDAAEGGINTLFLAAGFIRWKEKRDAEASYLAPLLLIPIKLDRKTAKGTCDLTSGEDEPVVNFTLLEYLRRTIELEIPVLDGDLPRDSSGVDITKIFNAVREAIKDVPTLEIEESVAIGTFSFSKYVMWKELENGTEHLRKSDVVRYLIDLPEHPFFKPGDDVPNPRDLDRIVKPGEVCAPLPSDSSQDAAIVAARQGKSFVLIGPPGTGKSQTIANIVANCLAAQKTILFVAEKTAALDVVYRRLQQIGLGDLCLELHSTKSNRKTVLAQLKDSWERRSRGTDAKWERLASDMAMTVEELNQYVEQLHFRWQNGLTIFEAFGVLASHAPAPFSLKFDGVDQHSDDDLRDMRELCKRGQRTHQQIEHCKGLEFLTVRQWSNAWGAEVTEAAKVIGRAQGQEQTSQDTLTRLLEGTGLERLGPFPHRLEWLQQMLSEVQLRTGVLLTPDQVSTFETALDRLNDAKQQARDLKRQLPLGANLRAVLALPLQDIQIALEQAYALPSMEQSRQVTAIFRQVAKEIGAVTVNPDSHLEAIWELHRIAWDLTQTDAIKLPNFDGIFTKAEPIRDALAPVKTLYQGLAPDTMSDELNHELQCYFDASLGTSQLRNHQTSKAMLVETSQNFNALLHKQNIRAAGLSVPEMAQRIAAHAGDLQAWCEYNEVRASLYGRGLGKVVEAIEAKTTNNAEQDFWAAYLSWWVRTALDLSPALNTFNLVAHQERIARLSRLDDELRALAPQRVMQVQSCSLPKLDEVAKNSPLGMLRHQIALTRPSMPIRKLINRLGDDLTELTPCLLMSPLSVSQYLSVDREPFDLVIFDEASQITTWDAVSTLARAKQTIVVGDPKQLPPTNFFGVSNDEGEDNEDDYLSADQESVLDELRSVLPNHKLTWHYRSRDEELITYSNRYFYNNELITFPSASANGRAVTFSKVDGDYDPKNSRRNLAEARALVRSLTDRALANLKLEPGVRPSIGVITMNMAQQDLVENLLDQERREAPDLEWYFSDDRIEPLIVKNLENIQGDQRDLIYISTTYGPDEAGVLRHHFGPLNKQGGERRLNVMASRAAHEMLVFSSMTADMIDLGRSQANGVALLKSFLAFAEHGVEGLRRNPGQSEGGYDSPFEEAVADALRARGWDVRTQIGVSGFRIDLAVVDPKAPGRFLAGIECDGASYHGSATARDRDKVREQVLRGLGWEILRVWSTDWFQHRQVTFDKLHAMLEQLKQSKAIEQ